jgi:hypothetical protein
MRSLSQTASFSHSPTLLLPAPKIAGLLPARISTSPTPDLIILRPERELPMRPFPTPAELDFDIYSTFLRIAQRFAELQP